MWIIPKNLHISPYVQDMEVSTLDLKELSEILELLLIVRSKPMQSATWYRKLKKDTWMQLLYGRILKHSHTNNFMEKWIFYLEASLVNLSAQQEKEKEAKTLDIYSPISSKELENWETLPLFSSKMYKESSVQNLKENGEMKRGLQFCFMCLENWKDWVMKQKQEYFQREKQELLTKEKEFLYLQNLNWSTPNTLDSLPIRSIQGLKKAVKRNVGASKLINLREQVDIQTVKNWKILQDSIKQNSKQLTLLLEEKNNIILNPQESLKKKKTWCTQTADLYKTSTMTKKSVKKRYFDKRQECISMQALTQYWATPTTQDYKGHYPKHSQEKKKRNLLPDQAHLETYKGSLNSRWVELLMGLPIGWTMISCQEVMIIELMNLDCLEMELYPIQQKQHLSYFSKDSWATPTAREVYPKTWATPRAAMPAMGGSSPETDQQWKYRLENQMLRQVQGIPVAEKKMLNPRWVELLMGLPIGWTMVTKKL